MKCKLFIFSPYAYPNHLHKILYNEEFSSDFVTYFQVDWITSYSFLILVKCLLCCMSCVRFQLNFAATRMYFLSRTYIQRFFRKFKYRNYDFFTNFSWLSFNSCRRMFQISLTVCSYLRSYIFLCFMSYH